MSDFQINVSSGQGHRSNTLDKELILAIVRAMAKVTSKLQLTVPKAIADRYGIRPGDQLNWTPAGDVIRVTRAEPRLEEGSVEARLRLFDEATERQRLREARRPKVKKTDDRGWTREELYDRGRPR